ncbi:MAG: hypothetical protein RDV48_12600 [Candidatus Eremiobacteraeota bacterium]|nr:hypothetical protein [Candidatus Eremiobacteraeota bacterium]
MKKFTVFALAFLLLASLGAYGQQVTRQNDQDYPRYRLQNAYYINGEKKTILSSGSWGGVLYSPQSIGNASLNKGLNETVIEGGSGKAVVSDQYTGSKSLSWPGGDAKAELTMNELKVTFKGNTYTYRTNNTDELIAEIPGDRITFKNSLNELTISGRMGTVKYSTNLDVYTIESKAGRTTYKKEVTGGYELKGIPADSHPYRYWGVYFSAPVYGLGIIVDFGRLTTIPWLPDDLDFDKAVIVR